MSPEHDDYCDPCDRCKLRALNHECVVWADDASPFTGEQVKALLEENQRYRDALEKIEGGDGCYTPSYGDCCDMNCAHVAREALRPTQPNCAAHEQEKKT